MNSRKVERQKAAQMEAAKRVGKRALTLSMAKLRADALFEHFEQEMKLLAADKDSEEVQRDKTVAATKRMENTTFSRTDALISVQLRRSLCSCREMGRVAVLGRERRRASQG